MALKIPDSIDGKVRDHWAGGWTIGGNVTLMVLERPTKKQIKNTEEMFGWKWIELEPVVIQSPPMPPDSFTVEQARKVVAKIKGRK